jgi:hypothetical protein
MIKIKKVIKAQNVEVEKPNTKKPEKEKSEPKKKSKLENYADVYKDEFKPLELQIDETTKFVFSVKRGGELGLPRVDIRQYVKTEAYEGFTKKGLNFPVELLVDFIEKCTDLEENCEVEGLVE